MVLIERDLFARSFGDRNCPARIKWLETRRQRDAGASAAGTAATSATIRGQVKHSVRQVSLKVASSDTTLVPWHNSRETTLHNKTKLAIIPFHMFLLFAELTIFFAGFLVFFSFLITLHTEKKCLSCVCMCMCMCVNTLRYAIWGSCKTSLPFPFIDSRSIRCVLPL